MLFSAPLIKVCFHNLVFEHIVLLLQILDLADVVVCLLSHEGLYVILEVKRLPQHC